MSDLPDNYNPPPAPNGWMKLYHPKGPQVTLPVTIEPMDYVALFENVTAALDAGFLVQAPGLEEGELKEDIGHVVKGFSKEGTPRMDLYLNNDQLKFSFLSVYLDSPEAIAAFEYASRLKFDSIPEYVGVGHLERGNVKTDSFVTQAPRPFGVVFKKNPKYDQEEAARQKAQGKPYLVASKRFVRWADQKPETKADAVEKVEKLVDQAASNESITKNMEAVEQWRGHIQAVRDGVNLNNMLKEIKAIEVESVRKAVWGIIKAHAESLGFVWDAQGIMFVKKGGR